MTSWNEIWARLTAFSKHLPENYEIEERLVEQYHSMLTELEFASGQNLANFRVPSEDLRPRVEAVQRGTRRQPGRTHYSKGKYCLRTTLLMKIDALLQFGTLRPATQYDERRPLLPSEQMALRIRRYADSAGVGQWRPTTRGELENAADEHGIVLVDCLKNLWSEGYLGLRKWSYEVRGVRLVCGRRTRG